ncbi:MAG: oligosaccharide flippase family protein, partial [Lactobacillales bacterium]|nr:oligosaccharide flippase family protein [Lactobacillales bacterium]
SPFFYARGDTTTPVRIGIVGVVLNSILSLVLMQFWGYVGIALATSITVWINALQYAVRLSKQGEFSLDTLFKYRLPRILFSVFIMSALLFFMEYAMNVLIPNWQHEGRFSSIFMLGGLVGFGVMVFGMSLIVLKAISLADLKRYVKRR